MTNLENHDINYTIEKMEEKARNALVPRTSHVKE